MKIFLRIISLLVVVITCFNIYGCTSEPQEQKNEVKHNVVATLKNDYSLEVPSMDLKYESAVPKAAKQARVIYVMNEPDSFSDKLTLATLQGLTANISDEQIFINNGGYSRYGEYIQTEWNCLTPAMINGKELSLKSVLDYYKDSISGYILCSDDKASDSGNIAVSLAGVLNAVVVTPKNEKLCKDLGMECLIDVRTKDDKWLRSSKYWQQLNKNVAIEQPLGMAPKLVDYAVMSKAYFSFYNGDDPKEHTEKYEFVNDGGIVFGYNNTLGEFDTVDTLSRLNLQLIPSDHAYNLSVLSGFRADGIKQKKYSYDTDGTNKHTVCILMSDGDNVQWLLNDFATSQKWYANSNRGKVNLGWGIAPTSVDLIAPMNAYLFDNMNPGEEFVAQLSGLGYTFPSRWSSEQRKHMAEKLSEYMYRTNINYAEILDDNGLKKDILADFTAQKNIDGLFYIDYENYAGKKGEIVWTNNKPTVSAKYRLWADLEDGAIDKIAKSINKADTDAKSSDAYSFIIVHAWSGLSGEKLVPNGNTMDAVKKLIDSFDEDVEVVTPSVFMDRIISNEVK